MGSSKSRGIVETATQSLQGTIRATRCSVEDWPWIAEHGGFLVSRFEVCKDGKDNV